MSLPQTLQIHKLIIPPLVPNQLLMIPTLDNPALIKDIDDIRLLDGTQSVRDCDCGSTTSSCIQRGLYDFLGFRVEG